MNHWIFTGVVHPERAGISFPTMNLSGSDRTGTINCEVSFSVSRALVTGEVAMPTEHERAFVRMMARQIVQRAIDILGFVEASGYEVEIHTVVEKHKSVGHQTLGFQMDSLAGEDDRRRREELVRSLPEQVLWGTNGITLHSALADLRMAIRNS
jgi:hypothetical protein